MEPTQQDAGAAPPRILVVDDNDAVRDLLVTVLKGAADYEVFEARDGAEAKALIESTPLDLVVTDLTMPTLTGLELMQWGHAHDPDLAWIILTGHGTFDNAVRAVQLGAFDFITKPLTTMNPMLISVRNALRSQRLGAEQKRLLRDIEEGNARLRQKVSRLKEACRILCEQAGVIESDLRRAELIQRALLPRRAPTVDGLAVDAVYRPSLNVGGDLYDVAAIGAGTGVVAAYLADAAGHGVSAAMLAVLFKHRLAMMDHDYHAHAPGEALALLNTALQDECSAPGLFVTAAYCLLDTRAGEITIASAGHPPLILRRADGRTEMIYHTGPALGLTGEARFAQKRLPFSAGDRLLMYTDGLCQAPEMGDALTSDEIAARLAGATGSGQRVLHDLLDDAQRRRGRPEQEDDITLLMLSAGGDESCLDNGQPEPLPAGQATVSTPRAEVLIGRSDGGDAVSISGLAGWTHCAAFHDACEVGLSAGRDLTLDLTRCRHLDSTFLGTIQDVVDHAADYGATVRIQGVLPTVFALFEELGMSRVIEAIATKMTPLPGTMTPLQTTGQTGLRNHAQILKAHRALASLSETNRQEFITLIEGLEQELAQVEEPRGAE